ncbi:MAG TPA: hypothetical protein VE155_15065 [Pseudonocardiaceae bacterium]|nr:hypothetical protein [Pseudonocardiaceae bacterium]
MAALHILAMVVGAALVVATMSDVVRRLVIPRARASAPAHVVDAVVDGVFQLLVRRFTDYENKDRVLAAEPAVYLLARLGALLFAFEVAYALLLWPWTDSLARAAGGGQFPFHRRVLRQPRRCAHGH